MVRLVVILALAEAAAGFGLVAPAMRAHAVSRPAAARAVPAALPRLAKVHMADDAAEAVAEPEPEKDGMMEALTTGSFFALWYLFNIGYNIYNKKALNALPIPYTMAALQLAAFLREREGHEISGPSLGEFYASLRTPGAGDACRQLMRRAVVPGCKKGLQSFLQQHGDLLQQVGRGRDIAIGLSNAPGAVGVR